MDLNIHHYIHDSTATTDHFKTVHEKLDQIIKIQGDQMALSEATLKFVKDIDDTSNQIAARIEALLNNPNTTEEEFRAALAPTVDKLKALGTTPPVA